MREGVPARCACRERFRREGHEERVAEMDTAPGAEVARTNPVVQAPPRNAGPSMPGDGDGPLGDDPSASLRPPPGAGTSAGRSLALARHRSGPPPAGHSPRRGQGSPPRGGRRRGVIERDEGGGTGPDDPAGQGEQVVAAVESRQRRKRTAPARCVLSGSVAPAGAQPALVAELVLAGPALRVGGSPGLVAGGICHGSPLPFGGAAERSASLD